MSSRSLVNVNLKTSVQEILENMGQLVSVLYFWLSVGGDEIESSERILVEIWRFPLYHFDGHDAKRPDVHLGAVVLPRDHLGRHPVGSADHGGPLVLL